MRWREKWREEFNWRKRSGSYGELAGVGGNGESVGVGGNSDTITNLGGNGDTVDNYGGNEVDGGKSQ